MTDRPVSVEDALARLVVWREEGGRRTVHTFRGIIGAAWSFESAREAIEKNGGAVEAEGFPATLGHTLAVRDGSGVVYFEASKTPRPPEPEPYSEEEIREMFLDAVRSNARYWAGLDGSNVPPERTTLERIQGALFSTLVILDGGRTGLPGFRVIPTPHPDDRQYHIDRGEHYFPDDVDIAGCLHELLYASESGCGT